MREKLFEYVADQYGIDPDYPFSTAPTYAVLRHPHNNKWFALVADVPGQKLGLNEPDRFDLVNVKIDDFPVDRSLLKYLIQAVFQSKRQVVQYRFQLQHMSKIMDYW